MYTIDHLVDNQSNRNPDKIAIKHGSRSFTYKDVSAISTQLSKLFKEQEIKNGDVIGVAIDRSPEMVISLLAIMKTGAAYLPLDNSFPIERINYMLNDSKIKVLIISESFKEKYKHHKNVIVIEDAWLECAKYDSQFLSLEVEDESLAYVLYTSGSTGNPKGVAVKHSGLINFLLSMQKAPGIDHNDVMLATTTISFDIAELEVFLPLISGAKLVIANADAVKDGRELLALARSEKITIMQGTPFMWRTMLEADWSETLSMKILCGGEAMPKELAKKLVTRCSSLWNMYGPTETTIWSLIKRISPDDEIITIGHPIDNTQVYLLDEELNEIPKGEIGEIYIGGAGVAKGYVNRPDLTYERFINDKFSHIEGQKIYKTGDLGKILENGELQCLGRIDHQIKIRGYRIETEEIEFQLKRQKDINEAVVVLYKDPFEHMHLVAYIVQKGHTSDDKTEELIKIWDAELQNSLPEYMVPDNYIVIPAIPLMTNGKIDRKSLPDPVIKERVLKETELPKTEMEVELLDIFLKSIAVGKIGINDNFFELGIDSLVAVKIMVQIEKQFDKRLPIASLIKYPTITKLALFLENKTDESPYKSIVPIKPNGKKIPLYIVHGIGLNVNNLYNMVSNMDPDQPVYGLQALGLDGTVEPLDNIEAIAQFYNNEIIHHNPAGPYSIAGYSFGGYIAYEMGKQLLAMGKEVKMLGMFDTNFQIPTHQYPLRKKIRIKGIRQFRKLVFRMGTWYKHPLLTLKYLITNYNQKKNILLEKMGFIEDYNPENMPEFMQEIASKLNFAFSNYIIKPYDIRIDLFKAGIRIYYVDDPKFLGWNKYALKGVNVHRVTGDHKEMFSSPNDKILALTLQNRLDQDN